MNVRNILAAKGDFVAMVGTGASVSDALHELKRHDVGALVVSDDGDHIDGILSERDVVRALCDNEATLRDRPVSAVMISKVETCGIDDTIPELMAVMTELRIRHLPVVLDDRLVGIVSIGDVVKRRLDELETLHDQMVGYIQGH